MTIRRPRRSIVVFAASAGTSDLPARTLAQSLERMGIETSYLGHVADAQSIASAVAEKGADAAELWLTAGGVRLLRELLRELIDVGRRDVSIVVHRVEAAERARSS